MGTTLREKRRFCLSLQADSLMTHKREFIRTETGDEKGGEQRITFHCL